MASSQSRILPAHHLIEFDHELEMTNFDVVMSALPVAKFTFDRVFHKTWFIPSLYFDLVEEKTDIVWRWNALNWHKCERKNEED